MTWTTSQQRRLQMEKQVLSKYFPCFQWINQMDSANTRVEGNICTNAKNLYTLRVYVPSDFPNSLPEMVVTSPYPLTGYGGKDLKDYGVSAAMHLLTPVNGYVKICHYRNWTPDLTLYLVVLKGRIWLEALEGHKKTGQPLDHFLRHMN
jgi:hypothetical protein